MNITNSEILFFDKNNIKNNLNIPFIDIYFDNLYGDACEYSDNAEWECCIYKDLIYVYIKKKIIFDNTIYYELITPYGYSGYYFKYNETYNTFIDLFRQKAYNMNYIVEIVRQNPYINIFLNKYEIFISKTTFGIKLNKYKDFENYLINTSRDNRRGYNIAIKNNLEFELNSFDNINLQNFKEIYNITMTNLNATNYYYFNNEYYNSFFNFKDKLFIANIKKNEKIISSAIIFKYNNFLHYHLGGSLLEYRNIRPNNFLHCNIIKYGIENNFDLYHLGGGLKDEDSLFIFKNKIADTKFNYNIYKNIINEKIYNEKYLNK